MAKSDDLKAWLAEAQTPQQSERIAHPTLMAEREDLRRQLDDLDDEDTPVTGRMSQKSPKADLEKRLAELDEQIESGGMLFTFQPLLPAEQERWLEHAKKDGADLDKRHVALAYTHAADDVSGTSNAMDLASDVSSITSATV